MNYNHSNRPLGMTDTELLLYDRNYYDLARTDGADKDITDYENNGKKYAANRGVMTNTLDYGESLNPVYGTIMDLISGKATLPKGALGNVAFDPSKKHESGYITNPTKSRTSMYTSHSPITESMLTNTLGSPVKFKPGIGKPVGKTPAAPSHGKYPVAAPAPRPAVMPRPVVSAAVSHHKPGGGVVVVQPVVGVGGAAVVAPVGGAMPQGGGGGGGGGEPEKKDEEAPAEAPAAEGSKAGDSKPNYIAMGIGALVGAIGGYMYAAKTGKSAIGFGIGGAVVGAGAGWAVGKYALKPKTETAPAGEEKKFCGCGA